MLQGSIADTMCSSLGWLLCMAVAGCPAPPTLSLRVQVDIATQQTGTAWMHGCMHATRTSSTTWLATGCVLRPRSAMPAAADAYMPSWASCLRCCLAARPLQAPDTQEGAAGWCPRSPLRRAEEAVRGGCRFVELESRLCQCARLRRVRRSACSKVQHRRYVDGAQLHCDS